MSANGSSPMLLVGKWVVAARWFARGATGVYSVLADWERMAGGAADGMSGAEEPANSSHINPKVRGEVLTLAELKANAEELTKLKYVVHAAS